MNPIHWACLSPIGRQILRIAYGFKSRGQTMFMKHSTIAKMVGCTRVTVARWIAVFIARRWFSLKKRHSHFAEYDVSQVTVTPSVTRDDTSPRRSSLINSVAEGTPPQKRRAGADITDLAIARAFAAAAARGAA